MGRRKQEREAAAAVLAVEESFEHSLRLFVAHCGGDVGTATVEQREKFDSALADIAAHTAALVLDEDDEL